MNQDFGRKVLEGVLEYVSEQHLGEIGYIDLANTRCITDTSVDGHGVIAVVEPGEYWRVQTVKKPTVLASYLPMAGVETTVGGDIGLCARLAVDHFQRLQLGTVALVRRPKRMDERLAQAFTEAAQALGMTVLTEPQSRNQEDIKRWLRQVPTPCGILGEHDYLAALVMEGALRLHRRVPEDIAALGIGNDPLVYLKTTPNLSSIMLPALDIGRRAAELLHQRLLGGMPASCTLAPAGLAARGSTAMLAVDDPVVAAATVFIRQRFASPIDSQAVANHVGLSRRALERRFVKVMGATLHDELARCRIERAVELLTRNVKSIKEVAHTIGFPDVAHFSRFVKHHTGLSPRQHRKDSPARRTD